MPRTVALATCREFPNLPPHDQLLVPELKKLGIEALPVIWDDPVDWKRFDAVIIRATWGYWQKFPDFLRWFDALEAGGMRVWNPLSVMRANVDKRYLRDLADRGLPVVPTEWVEPGHALGPVLARRGWSEVIVKPVVSSGSNATYHLKSSDDPATFEARLRESWVAGGPAMVQPFLPEIRTEGEYSFIFIGGEFSHAILKTAAAGDFRIQWMYGGTSRSVTVEPAWVAEAQKILATIEEPLLYARVDMCRFRGTLHLMELELTEPNLFFGDHLGSAARFAECLKARVVGEPR